MTCACWLAAAKTRWKPAAPWWPATGGPISHSTDSPSRKYIARRLRSAWHAWRPRGRRFRAPGLDTRWPLGGRTRGHPVTGVVVSRAKQCAHRCGAQGHPPMNFADHDNDIDPRSRRRRSKMRTRGKAGKNSAFIKAPLPSARDASHLPFRRLCTWAAIASEVGERRSRRGKRPQVSDRARRILRRSCVALRTDSEDQGAVQWHGRPSQCRGFRPVPASPPSAALSRLQARQRDAVCLAGHVHSDSQGPTFRQQTRKVTWRGPIGHHATVAVAAVEVCSIPRLCATTQGLVQTPSAPTAQRCLGAVGED